MSFSKLVTTVATETKLSKAKAEAVVKASFTTIKKTLKKTGYVAIPSFGSFTVKTRKARNGRNPATGAAIKIKAKKVTKFRTSSKFTV